MIRHLTRQEQLEYLIPFLEKEIRQYQNELFTAMKELAELKGKSMEDKSLEYKIYLQTLNNLICGDEVPGDKEVLMQLKKDLENDMVLQDYYEFVDVKGKVKVK